MINHIRKAKEIFIINLLLLYRMKYFTKTVKEDQNLQYIDLIQYKTL